MLSGIGIQICKALLSVVAERDKKRPRKTLINSTKGGMEPLGQLEKDMQVSDC